MGLQPAARQVVLCGPWPHLQIKFTPLPMKMELIEGSETSAYINQSPGNYPKGNLLN